MYFRWAQESRDSGIPQKNYLFFLFNKGRVNTVCEFVSLLYKKKVLRGGIFLLLASGMMKVNTNENAQFGLQRTKDIFLRATALKVLAVVIISQGGTSPFLKLWQITEWFEYKFKKTWNLLPILSWTLEESILYLSVSAHQVLLLRGLSHARHKRWLWMALRWPRCSFGAGMQNKKNKKTTRMKPLSSRCPFTSTNPSNS